MGVDTHAINHFIHVYNKFGSFGETVTLGRQGVHLKGSFYQSQIDQQLSSNDQQFCEKLLQSFFGAKNVDSIDNSDYEGATIIHDMNKPISADLNERYDTVIDVGTLEHVFDIAKALKNCSKICKVGGRLFIYCLQMASVVMVFGSFHRNCSSLFILQKTVLTKQRYL